MINILLSNGYPLTFIFSIIHTRIKFHINQSTNHKNIQRNDALFYCAVCQDYFRVLSHILLKGLTSNLLSLFQINLSPRVRILWKKYHIRS